MSKILKTFEILVFLIVASAVMNISSYTYADTEFSLKAFKVLPHPDTSVIISWAPVSKARYYMIHRNEVQIKYIDINTERNYLTHTDCNLTPGTKYTYKVTALDSTRIKLKESTVCVTTSKMLRPSDVTIDYNLSTKKITLDWTINSKAAVQSIIRKVNGPVIAEVYGTRSVYSFYDTDLSENTSARYVIISSDSYGNKSEPSDVAVIKPAVTPFITAVMKDGVATVSWGKETDVSNFILERSRYDDESWGEWKTVSSRLSKERTCVRESPKAGGTYRYRLNNRGWGGCTVQSNISQPVTKPAVPDDLNCYVNLYGDIKVTWENDINNLSELRLQRKSDGEEYRTVAFLEYFTTKYTDTFASSGEKNFTYRILAWESEDNYSVSAECKVSLGKPAAPTHLKITVVSDNTLYLEWKDNSNNETGFKLERRSDGNDFEEIEVVGSNMTSYVDTDVIPGNTYTYRIKSYNSYGSSLNYTNTVSVDTDVSINSPDSLSVESVSSTQIDLTWTYPDFKNYNSILQRKKGTNGDWKDVANLASGVIKYSDKELLPDTRYFYRVKAALGAYLFSTFYPEGDTAEGFCTKLRKPSELNGVTTTKVYIQLSWKDNSNETEFLIERKVGEGSFIKAAYVYADQNSWLDTSVQPDTRYTYRVKALTNDNESTYSEEKVIISSILKTPAELYAEAVLSDRINLSWEDRSENETGFELWRRSKTGDWKMIKTLGRDSNTAVDTGLEQGKWYYYKVKAYSRNRLGVIKSGFSNTALVKNSIPYPPQNISYSVISPSHILLRWDDVSNSETGYEVQKKTGEHGQWNTAGNLNAESVSFNDKDIKVYTPYYYRIKVYNNEFKSSSFSENIKVVTGIPKNPSELYAETLSPDMVKLKWNDNSNNEYGFKIERKTYFGGYRIVAKTGPDVTEYTDEGLMPDTGYYYRIKAYNLTGDTEYSNEVCVKTGKKVTFDDIKDIYWAKDAIEKLAGMGIIRGRTKFLFCPGDNISRAEFTAIIVRAFKFNKVPVGSFTDVMVNHWAYREILIARELGIVEGENNMFYPDNPVTREEMAVITAKTLMAAGYPLPWHDVSILNNYMDRESISEDAIFNMAALNGEGIISGRTKYTINPKDTLTRAEAAVILYRVLGRIDK